MKSILSILFILHLFVSFYCFSLSVFSSSVSSWGPATLGPAFGPLARGCCPVDCSGPGGWRTLHLGVGPLVCPGRDCLCGGAPCGRGPGALSVWSAPQGGSFLAIGLGARPCLCLTGAVGLSLCVRACLSVWVFMGMGGLVCFIIVVFSLCEALCVAFKV